MLAAVFGAGGIGIGDPLTVGVTESGNCLLCNQYLAALSTLYAVCQAGFRASGGVTHHSRSGFMCAFCFANKAAFVTSVIVFVIVRMTESIHGGLLNEDFMAYRAMLALSQACHGAGGSNGNIDDFGVTESGNGFVLDGFIASRADLMLAAVFGAGSIGIGDPFTVGVVCCMDALRFLFAASADALLFTIDSAGGIFGDCPLTERMNMRCFA